MLPGSGFGYNSAMAAASAMSNSERSRRVVWMPTSAIAATHDHDTAMLANAEPRPRASLVGTTRPMPRHVAIVTKRSPKTGR
jgi:hypothetical protein